MDINKEFEEAFAKQDAEWRTTFSGRVSPERVEAVRVAFKAGYIAAATPRDLLIEQLVKALNHAKGVIGVDRSHDDPVVESALSAAKKRGYGD